MYSQLKYGNYWDTVAVFKVSQWSKMPSDITEDIQQPTAPTLTHTGSQNIVQYTLWIIWKPIL